ncbi:MAG: 50S ribosome-binding GTPase [Methanomicrobiales archaeon]|nr:50S ribosome-binding GTPase [Methanomicrobiales archaeon]
MQFEKMKTVPTADEILDRSFRRAARKMREKRNKDRANEEFVRAVSSAVHDRLVQIMQDIPIIEDLSPFYQDMVDILFGIDRFKKSLGAVGWAAKQTRVLGSRMAREVRWSPDTQVKRKQAVARIASVVHQIDEHLRFLNDARNTLRKLPDIREEYTVVVAGYPNVGKSSFIRLVSTAEPEIAEYPFTTREIILGHRKVGRRSIQFVDTPGLLYRPRIGRNAVEQQAINALMHVADLVLYILDPSETCGYSLSDQLSLLEEMKDLVPAPMIVVVNKADELLLTGYSNMSTLTGEGVDAVLQEILTRAAASSTPRPGHSQSEIRL